MTETRWGLDADGHPKTAHEAAHERIEQAVRDYVRVGLRTAGQSVDEIRHLHLAEPHLPASKALEALERDGLMGYPFDPARHAVTKGDRS